MHRAETDICPHGCRRRSNCKRCSVHLVCQHNMFKRRCVVCTGGCQHGKKRYACMTCNPNLTCVHGVWKYSCPTCNPPKLKNTAEFKQAAYPSIIRAKISYKFQEQFTHPVRYCTVSGGENATRTGTAPDDQQDLSLVSYEMQRELVQSLWRNVADEGV